VVALAAFGCTPAGPAPDALTILLPADVRSLDPNAQIESVTDGVLSNVYEPLVDLDPHLRPRPVLARSWEHPQPERWRFRLRPDVRFHDGSPLTAEAVRTAIEALRAGPAPAEAAQFLNQVREVAVVDPLTLDLVTHEPRALLSSLSFFHVTKPNAAGRFPALAGTGPFRLKERQEGRHVSVERWDGYWGPRPQVGFAAFLPVASAPERLARVERGEADVAAGVPPALARAGGGGSVSIVRGPGLTVMYLGLGLRPPSPFTDPRVRRAFHLAIDRQELLRRALDGTGSVATQPVAPRVFGFDPRLPPTVHDPAAARRLLAEAGHARGLRVRLDHPDDRYQAARVLQEQLARVGVTLDLSGMRRGDLWDRAADSALFFAGWDCATGEASEFFEFCLHSPGRGYGGANYGGFAHRRLDEIVETNTAALDPRVRQGLLQEAASIAMEELPVLPLYVEDDVYAVRRGLLLPQRADNALRLAEIRVITSAR
jgi:peptide/nickel transport system substrate-binding protein